MTSTPAPVARVAALMSAFRPKWCLAGGWAADASLGRKTREHEDIEIAIFRNDQRKLFDHLSGWSMQYVANGNIGAPGQLEPWSGAPLALPVHEIHARSAEGFALEVLLNERDSDRWVFRRDERVTLAVRSLVVKSPWLVPTLAPEIVLLYKAKDARPKDELDFATLRPHLTEKQCYWLWEAISLVHPGHPWLTPLSL